MITVGIGGRIGAGKSTVARRFGELGARVVDADALAHEVLEEPGVTREIVARFGAGMLGPEGRVDRGRLAAAVFGPSSDHAAARAALEAIVHPRVRARIAGALAETREAERAAGRSDSVVVLDVPLLVRSGWHGACDRVVLAVCDDRVRRERLDRRGLSAEQQAARDAAGEDPGADTGGTAADRPENVVAVDTSGDLAYTFRQVDRIWDSLRGR
ncbi:MAG: dephospho-CoA kinase [Planctomycetia bacterium]|nr:dephospho-CoA kinase [Planctomycetia bacterium]